MKRGLWTAFDIAVSAAFIGVLVTIVAGCTFTLKDNGEIGFKQSTEWAFYHQTSETKSTASSNLEAPSVEEWLFKGKDTETPPSPKEPAAKPDGGTPGGSP